MAGSISAPMLPTVSPRAPIEVERSDSRWHDLLPLVSNIAEEARRDKALGVASGTPVDFSHSFRAVMKMARRPASIATYAPSWWEQSLEDELGTEWTGGHSNGDWIFYDVMHPPSTICRWGCSNTFGYRFYRLVFHARAGSSSNSFGRSGSGYDRERNRGVRRLRIAHGNDCTLLLCSVHTSHSAAPLEVRLPQS